MKVLEKYYKKIYNHTNKLLKKVFGLNVNEAIVESHKIKKDIEKAIKKPIAEITLNDLIENKLSHLYCKYRTLNNILKVISGASFLNSFCKEDMEEIINEG